MDGMIEFWTLSMSKVAKPGDESVEFDKNFVYGGFSTVEQAKQENEAQDYKYYYALKVFFDKEDLEGIFWDIINHDINSACSGIMLHVEECVDLECFPTDPPEVEAQEKFRLATMDIGEDDELDEEIFRLLDQTEIDEDT
jgi:hypothetical protein